MVFKSFTAGVVLRLLVLLVLLCGLAYTLVQAYYVITATLLVPTAFMLYALLRYLTNSNRKLTRFLQSIQYADFSSGFTADDKLGSSFKQLNQTMNQVLEAFRQSRGDTQEALSFLNTIVQHINTGLISFVSTAVWARYAAKDTPEILEALDGIGGQVNLFNNAAKRLLGLNQLQNVHHLQEVHPELYEQIVSLAPGRTATLRMEADVFLSINAIGIKLGGVPYTLVALQNIHSEIQQNETVAWQNLTRVLRHEIMNSVAPIHSLSGTMEDILNEDAQPVRSAGSSVKDSAGGLAGGGDVEGGNGDVNNGLVGSDEVSAPTHYMLDGETMGDLKEGLQTIGSRTKALIRFVDVYRSFISIPQPKFERFAVKGLLERVHKLMEQNVSQAGIRLVYNLENEEMTLMADASLVENVLINLVKNAIEALQSQQQEHGLGKAGPAGPAVPVPPPVLGPEGLKGQGGALEVGGQISLYAWQDTVANQVCVRVTDNGPGILAEALERVFIPFFSTKPTGSGIGLALSRQIMQLHHGTIAVTSQEGHGTEFVLRF